MQNRQIQTYLAKRVATAISENLQADFSIESMDLIFFNRVVMKEVKLMDRYNDTLLYSPTLIATLKKYDRRNRQINLSRLKFENATIRIAVDSARVNNLSFIVDALKAAPDTAMAGIPDSTDKEKWAVRFEALDLHNSIFILDFDFRPREVPYGINFTDLRIENMDLNSSDFIIANDTVIFTIDHLAFREKSGFIMDHLQAVVHINEKFFFWRDVQFRTGNSDVNANRIDFRFDSWKDFGMDEFGNKGIFNKVKLDFRFSQSEFYLPDVAYFAWTFKDIDRKANFAGTLRGRISSFKGDNIRLDYGEGSRFMGEFDLMGLPDIEQTFMYFDIDELTTSMADIERLQMPGKGGDTLVLSENLESLGNISYHGKFTGFYNDFVTYGSLNTDMGIISSDLSIRPDENDNVHFRGEISTEGFDLGQIADLEDLAGRMSMEGNVEGISYRGGELSGKMDGHISLLELNQYPYQNIYLAGELSNRKFDGSFSVEDPNLRMEFFGKIDFTDTLPVFDFTADVDRAMLNTLNLAEADPNYRLSCYLRANFIGANLDDFDGEVNLVNSLFQKQDKQIQIYNFNLVARHRPDSKQMILSSDLVDAEITGKYEFEDIGKAAGMLLAYHIPSFRNIVKDPLEESPSLNNFQYSVNFKNTFPITDFFIPEVQIARNSNLSGTYNPSIREFNLSGEFPSLEYKENHFEGLEINISSDSTMAGIMTHINNFSTGSRINMDNLLINATALNNEIEYGINWLNENPEENYSGSLTGMAEFEYRKRHVFPKMDLHIKETEVLMGDTLWALTPSTITVDTTFFGFHDFMISHAAQSLSIDGAISEDPEQELKLSFSNIDLGQMNEAFGGIQMGGVLNGNSTISGIYNKLVFLSDLNIDSLTINNERLGNTFIRANWIDPEQKVEVEMEALRGKLKTLEIRGNYFPENREIDFMLSLDKLKLNILQPYIEDFITELEGISNGTVTLSGNVNQPVLNGELSVQKTSFKLDYLQTKYSFSDRLQIRNNNFFLNDVSVYDEEGSRAVFNGTIETDYLKDPVFDFDLDLENFRVLATRQTHNQLYYGDAVATGRVGLDGVPGNMRLAIAAKTERGTHISIPINQGRDIQENDFITFINSDPDMIPIEEEEEYSVDLGGFVLDFQLEVTEDATTEIIFDPQVGDVLQGEGNGNLQLSINPNDGFQMFGDYTIQRGEYLFTLQNIINKRLKIQRGGTITWNGEPTQALININAIYNAKAAPGVLVPDPPEYLKKRMPVECHLVMEGNLLSPLISFDIVLPTAEEETRNVVRNAITTDEELTKQFLSLLVINNFSSVATGTGGSTGTAGAGMAGVTASELLSNQLSNWLSQISNDFDIGVNYRPGDEITSDQVEVALSTQIFDDRVSIHTNVDVNTNSNSATSGQRTSTIAGDFDVEFKLSDDGKLRLKAYNRYNHDQLYKTSPYTQGVGLLYREEFNSFAELGQRYADAITGDNRKKKKKGKKNQEVQEGEQDEEGSPGNR